MDDRITVGLLLGRSIDALFANIVPLVLLATVIAGVPGYAGDYWRLAGPPAPIPEAWFELGVTIVEIVLFALFQAIALPLVIRQIAGQRRRLGADIGTGLLLFVPVTILTIMVGIACLIGLVILIVPGIIFYVIYSVSVPAYLEERPGLIWAMGRSQDLTEGVRWQVFAVLAIYWIAAIAISVLAQIGALQMVEEAPLSPAIVAAPGAAARVIVDVIYAAVVAAIYVALRQREGASGDLIADVFA